MSTPDKRLIPSRGVRKRYGDVSSRTLRRWRLSHTIPPPDLFIRGLPYWWESTLIAHERRLVAEAAKVSSSTT
jgi:hypothetical protein